MPFQLESERLILRDYFPEDWQRVHLYASDPEFSRYELWGPNTEKDSKEFVKLSAEQAKQNPRYKFEVAICLKQEKLLIGGCGLRRESTESHIANLGWAINPDFQNQGFATEAAQRLIQFAFSELKLAVIYATCDTRNIASFRVMEKLGMRRVGFTQGKLKIKNHVRDSYRYEILRPDGFYSSL